MKPTDNQLNIACAELFGWMWYRYSNKLGAYRILLDPSNERLMNLYKHLEGDADMMETDCSSVHYPDFCNDRNQLPILLTAVYSRLEERFMDHLYGGTDEWGRYIFQDSSDVIELLKTDMRTIITAVLKTREAWNQDWTLE